MSPASSRSRFPGLRLAQRTAFITRGGLSAVCSPPVETGRLPAEWVERYRADETRIVYVVLSYATPIAWICDHGEVVIPACRYSLITTRHQQLCRTWL
ncbi:hypothetical protein [Nonomuraea angiospora]|uniref:hypothetical protein n=1 Tax=Nonomuraea angiospora TaxID=46172 RepID=UPI0029BCFF6C|nr:hypothetical protein [Nonomuraea angiospora]MDX3106890.1 hypothetical protein [Nonomuraea angiospora]